MNDITMSGSMAGDDMISDMREYFPPDISDEELVALYDNPDLLEKYLRLQYNDMQQSYSVFNECVIPVTTQAFEQMWQILFYCLVLRCLSKLRVNQSVIHLASVVFGFLSIWKFYGKEMVFVVFPLLFFMPFFHLRKLFKGYVVCAVATTYLVACELFLLDAVQWNKVKGSVMIGFMKAISIVFDTENCLKEIPSNMLEFYGYVFNPTSIIFGPFITYKNYMQLFQGHSMNISWLLHCLRSVFLCAACLVWSSCGVGILPSHLSAYVPSLEDNMWWTAYLEAQAFRFSHYFVSYFSESSCLFSGIGTMKAVEYVAKDKKEEVESHTDGSDETKNNSKDISLVRNVIITWRVPVANILQVELPGSLVDVVTNWNLSMHFWLKNYIYKSTRKYGVFIAVLVTYIASSILHGMNFQLSAVLLSIGIFAYIESIFRHTLAMLLNACIEARPCKTVCTHYHHRRMFWVMAVNLLFSFLAVWNLAYLGCLFDNSPDEEKGYSMSHALQKWRKYGYLNHYIMVALFSFHLVIKAIQPLFH